MNIRKATRDDFPLIQQMANIIWPNTFSQLMDENVMYYLIDVMYNTSSLIKQTEELNINYLIIEKAGKPVGYCSYELNYENSSRLMVHRLYFMPQTQGIGLGSKTLKYLEEKAQSHHLEIMCLKVLHNNDKAYNYYLHRGLKKTGESYNHIGNNYPPFLDFILEKKINDAE